MKRENISYCRKLRNNQTDAEGKLWSVLKGRQLLGVKFRRQFSISNYILDFYSAEYKLAIEADGGQHYDKNVKQYDERRTRDLASLGILVLRYDDSEILNNIEGVYENIENTINKMKPPHHFLLPYGEKKNREKIKTFL